MNQLSTMKIFNSFENLIENIDLMHFLENFGPY